MQLHRALRFVWQSARAWKAAGVLLLVVQGFLPLLTLYLIKLIVEDGRSFLETGRSCAS